MRDSYRASLPLSLELFCVIITLNATLLAMEAEAPRNREQASLSQCRAKAFYVKQRSECRNLLLLNIDRFLLVLPAELGCGPCRLGHWALGSVKYYHVEARKNQLTSLKTQLIINRLCTVDIAKYINEVMGEFIGEYGQNFKTMCLTMLSGVHEFFKEYYFTLENQGTGEGYETPCALCDTAEAQVRYSCGHLSTCVPCEEKRLYHVCLLCGQENLYRNLKNNEVELLSCIICFDAPRNSLTLPCGHAHCCFNCSGNISNCAVCKVKINKIIKFDTENHRELCHLCSENNSDVISLSCEHISICQSCLVERAEYTCAICQKLCESSNTSKIFQ